MNAPTTQRPTGCVMLVPRAFDPPIDLLDGLRRRGTPIREVSDAPAVMLALDRPEFATVVVVEPRAVLDLQPLLGAIRRFHPHVRLWQYRWNARPRLSVIETAGAAAAPVAPADPLTDAVRRSAQKEAPTEAAAPPVDRQPSPAPSGESISLTEQELAMLLGSAEAPS